MAPAPIRFTAGIACLLAAGGAPLAGIPPQQVRDQCADLHRRLAGEPEEPGQRRDLILILGATAQEAARFPGDPVRCIFVSREADAEPAPYQVLLDFNNLFDLATLQFALRGRLDAIIPDRSVMKFTEWGAPHLKHFKAMLRPTGTLFIPVRTWESLQFGLDLGGAPDARDFPRLTGDPERDAETLADLLQVGWANLRALEERRSRFPPLFPTTLVVPKGWAAPDGQATRARALDLWMRTRLVPELRTRILKEAGFSSVTLVHFTPTFLQVPGTGSGGEAYLALKP